MRYFLMKPDKQISDAPIFKDFHRKINVQDISPKRYKNIPERLLLLLEPNPHTVFPDILLSPVLMLSYDAWIVLKQYEPYMRYCELVMLDQVNSFSQVYFLPILEQVDCLVEESQYDKIGALLEKPALSFSAIPKYTSIFQISGMRTIRYVIRMDLAESMLVRNIYGLQLNHVDQKLSNKL